MKNIKVENISNFKLIFFLLLATCYLLLTTSASAWVIGDPLVPCGGAGQPECTQCELLHLVKNLIDFILIAAAPILATFFFIVAGLYIMLGGARPDMLATGKRMFTSALIGIIIVMLAWLITNTLIQTLVDTSKVGSGGNWFQFSCDDIGLSKEPPGSGGGGGGGGGGTYCNPPCSSGQVCVRNAQGILSCQTVPTFNCGPCDPMTNAGCSSGQQCILNISTNICSCR